MRTARSCRAEAAIRQAGLCAESRRRNGTGRRATLSWFSTTGITTLRPDPDLMTRGRSEWVFAVPVFDTARSRRRKENGTRPSDRPGGRGSISFEIDPSLMNEPEVFVSRGPRPQYQLCEAAMTEELHRLKAKANGNGHAAVAHWPGGCHRPAQAGRRLCRRSGDPPPRHPSSRLGRSPRPPRTMTRSTKCPRMTTHPTMAITSSGGQGSNPAMPRTGSSDWESMRYPNRILDWSPKQVQTAYQTYREAHRG